eukprot:TRINITY_DN24788_c0_g1_i1.p1 TRINITY_DN24788_c0_g1~~TRINITY_DN24788_c0_g1_i1.p1  ORF type:complete len:634 (+),score=124.98 TRINITY_DN24788_c0_g1_i1:58-1959(+)
MGSCGSTPARPPPRPAPVEEPEPDEMSVHESPPRLQRVPVPQQAPDPEVVGVEFRIPGSLPLAHNPGGLVVLTASSGKVGYSVNGADRPRYSGLAIVRRRHGVALFFDKGEDGKHRNVYLPTSSQAQRKIIKKLGEVCEEGGMDGLAEKLEGELREIQDVDGINSGAQSAEPSELSATGRLDESGPDRRVNGHGADQARSRSVSPPRAASPQGFSTPPPAGHGVQAAGSPRSSSPPARSSSPPAAEPAGDEQLVASPLRSPVSPVECDKPTTPLQTGPSEADIAGGRPHFLKVVFPADVSTAPVASVVKVMTQYGGGVEGESLYQWQRRFSDGVWHDIALQGPHEVETGRHWGYCPGIDDAGSALRVVATPVRADDVTGAPQVSPTVACQLASSLCVTVVQQLISAQPGVQVDVVNSSLGAQSEPRRLILQLIEKQIKLKPPVEAPFSFATGVFDENHAVRCTVDPRDSRSFLLSGLQQHGSNQPLELSVTVADARVASTDAWSEDRVIAARQQRDLIVCLIRVWAAISDPSIASEFLDSSFVEKWQSGLRRVPREKAGRAGDQRADLVWRVFEEQLPAPFRVRQKPRTSAEEARSALGNLRSSFSSGAARRPASVAGSQRREELLRQHGAGR